MKLKAINHEVLFFTSTHFPKRKFYDKTGNCLDDSSEGQLPKTCWSGLILKILPDIPECWVKKDIRYTWEAIPAENFIEFKIGAAPFTIENARSVNPYFFLFEKNFN